jgi:hypothetical protein
MNTAQTIAPKDMPFAPDAPKHLDYDFLREEGMKHIRDLSGQLWTDHNTHDPGITILEVLSYALTDLAYRTQLPDADLFAPDPKARMATGDDNFPTAFTMLSCNPVTELDWRKLLLDIKGVRNAWIFPIETDKFGENRTNAVNVYGKNQESKFWKNDLWETESLVLLDKDNSKLTFANAFQASTDIPVRYPLSIRGVYKIRLELEQNIEDKEPILTEVRRRLAGHRNLCEDFGDISIVQDDPLTLCGEFELDATAQPDTVMLDIFNRIQAFFSPTIRFYSLREMLEKGRTMEEIYAGRPMQLEAHGFVDTAELEALTLPTEIRVSDLYHLILGDDLKENPNGLKRIEGVSAIKKLLVINPQTDSTKQVQAWKVKIREGARPTLNVAASIVGLTFLKRGVPYRVNGERVANLFEKRLANPSKVIYNLENERAKGRQNLDAAVPTGEHRADLGIHVSIQHDFPLVYGIGESALPESVGIKRRAQAAQLKGYLTFFDHLLANFLAQLSNTRTLFSPQLTNNRYSLPLSDAANQPWLGLSPDAFEPLAPVSDLRKSIPNANLLFGFAPDESDVQIGDSATAKNKTYFDHGDIVAKSPATYPTPHDRDRALRQLIADMDADLVDIKTETFVKTGELDRFYFLFVSHLGRKVTVKSLKTFATIKEAQAVAQTVRFVATLDTSFEKINRPTDPVPNYTFQLVYRPPQYETYLRTILEDEATFFKQKNRQLDHLLSRFAEDFTDYTLLTFATLRNAGQQIDTDNNLALSRQFALDKARFLQNYPEISRNRAKAVDFSKNIWTDANQSGLENRVSRLIGIDERGTKTLNYFDIAPRPTRFQFVISDVHFKADKHVYTPLMQSVLSFENKTQATEARKVCIHLGKNKALFERTYCPVEDVYGFRLLDAQGCPLAESVDTFGSATLRDTKLRYVQGLFAGNGLMREFRADTEGVFFDIADGLGGQLRAEMGAQDEITAMMALMDCLQALPIRAHWQPTDDEAQQRFGFQIIVNQIVIAIHTDFFKTKTERDKRLNAAFDFFKQNKLLWQTQQHPPRHRWQVTGLDNKILLTGWHYFNTPKQAGLAWQEAKRAILDADFGQLEAYRVGDKFGIQLLRFVKDEDGRRTMDASLILAQATFNRADERNAAIYALKKLAKALESEPIIGDFWQSQILPQCGAASLDTEGGKFSLNLPLNGSKEEGLFGDALFLDKNTALAATFALSTIDLPDTLGQVARISKVVNVAESADNYLPFKENGGCIFGFNIKNETQVLASFEPLVLTADAAIAKRQAVVKMVQDHKLDIKLNTIVSQRWFEVMDETCDEKLMPILRGVKHAMNLTEIGNHFDTFVEKVKSGEMICEVPKLATFFQFKLQEVVWAISVDFASEAAAVLASKALLEVIKLDFKEPIGAEDAAKYLPIEQKCADESLSSTLIENPNRWRLSDADNGIARYVAHVFDVATLDSEIDEVREKLISDNASGQQVFSMIYENIDNYDSDIYGNHWFVLRDAHQRYWRSSAHFGSSEEALQAFRDQHIDVLTVARTVQNYRIRSREVNTQKVFYIELLDFDGKPMAESVQTAADTEGVNEVLSMLQQHALAYPILKKRDDSFGFQLFDAQKQVVLWQSLRSYKTPKEAKTVFNQFLNMLIYRGNFRMVTAKDGCRKYIDLIEVLLEAVTTQQLKNDNQTDTTDCDWQSVESFIDDFVDAREGAFVPTVDYQNGCGYGFKLARAGYRLARHPLSFHSKMGRENRRDALWQVARCRQTATNTEGSAIGAIMADIEVGNYQRVENICKQFEEKDKRAVLIGENLHNITVKHAQTIYSWKYIGQSPATPILFDEVFVWDVITAFDGETPISNSLLNELETIKEAVLAEAENFKTRRKQALEEARCAMPNFNSWLVLTEDDGSLRLGITRADGSLIIVFDEWAAPNADAMAAEIPRLYAFINTRSEVIALPDGTFGFEIREKTADKTFIFINGLVDALYDSLPVALPVFKVVWRNIAFYKTAAEAQVAVEKVHGLLNNKTNYARTTAADGSQTLEIVDPTKIIAQHPRTYSTTTARDAAWQNARRHIHTEGMHLVEHLLLRPRFGESVLTIDEQKTVLKKEVQGIRLTDSELNLLKNEANKRLLPTYLIRNEAEHEPQKEIEAFDVLDTDDAFDDYILGADPYSFWLTIVLPHWSARFRDLDFRDFFEGTLRREAPAHVGLNILWVNPKQMMQFEKVWRSWLEVAADPTHNLYACRKKSLLHVFTNLKSITPEAGLLDCSTGVASQLIILDKTTLR